MKKLELMSAIAAVLGSYLAPELSHAANSDGQAATFTTFYDRTTFLNSLPGPPTDSEDFEGFSLGANLQGVEFITGVNVTSNALGGRSLWSLRIPKLVCIRWHYTEWTAGPLLRCPCFEFLASQSDLRLLALIPGRPDPA
jgi:hypothetical protein